MRKFVIPMILVLATSACSSIVEGTTQPLTVTSEKGADCSLKSSIASYAVTAPATITVQRSIKDLDVTCTKEGFETANTKVEAGVDPWFFGNVLFGGLLGLTIDAASGAMAQYPGEVKVDMQKAAEKAVPTS